MDKLRNVDENRPIDYLNLNERFIESREIRLTISLSRILIKISIFEDTEKLLYTIFSTRREDFEDLENLEIEKKNEKGRGEFLIHLANKLSILSRRRGGQLFETCHECKEETIDSTTSHPWLRQETSRRYSVILARFTRA